MQLFSLAEHYLINPTGEDTKEKPLICCVHAPAGMWRRQDLLRAAKQKTPSNFSILLLGIVTSRHAADGQ